MVRESRHFASDELPLSGKAADSIHFMIGSRAELSPFERRVIGAIAAQGGGLNGNRQALHINGVVAARALADYLGVKKRTLSYHLLKLERTGLIRRPNGPQGGYALAAREEERKLLRVVREGARNGGGVMSSLRAAAVIGAPERSARYYLAGLERRGWLTRPNGPRSGYALALSALGERVIWAMMHDDDPYGRARQGVATRCLAEKLRIPERTLRWHLARLEAKGAVARPFGPRSGWVTVYG
jgi:DNA-binding IscR family transcriptional regulator